jgi:hypothetical protein
MSKVHPLLLHEPLELFEPPQLIGVTIVRRNVVDRGHLDESWQKEVDILGHDEPIRAVGFRELPKPEVFFLLLLESKNLEILAVGLLKKPQLTLVGLTRLVSGYPGLEPPSDDGAKNDREDAKNWS